MKISTSLASFTTMTTQEQQSVTRHEAARILGLSVKRIDQLRDEGRLAAERDPRTGRVAVDLESLHRLIVARRGVVGHAHRWVFRRSDPGAQA